MNNIANDPKVARRSRTWRGVVLVCLSLVAVVLSLGAPGLGWVLASVILIAASLCASWVGPRWVYLCLAVTVLHFVTFGPLSYSGASRSGADWIVWAILGWGPFVISGAALLVPRWRRRKALTIKS